MQALDRAGNENDREYRMSLDDDFIPRVNDSGIALASVRYFNAGRDHKTVEAFLRNRPPACRGPAKSRRLTAEGVSAPLRVDYELIGGPQWMPNAVFRRDQQLPRFALIRRLGAEFLRENPMSTGRPSAVMTSNPEPPGSPSVEGREAAAPKEPEPERAGA